MPAAPALFEQLEKSLKGEGDELVKRVKVRGVGIYGEKARKTKRSSALGCVLPPLPSFHRCCAVLFTMRAIYVQQQ
jgi:hypothetical protein